MRIVFLSPIGHIGGAERVLLDLIWGMRQVSPEIEIHVLTLAHGPLGEEAANLGARVSILAAPDAVASLGDSAKSSPRALLLLRSLLAAPATWKLARSIRRKIEEISPDIAHSIGLKTHLLLGIANPKGLRRVWHIHDFVSQRPLIAALLRRVARDVAAIAISQAVADDVRGWLPNADVRVVLNGIDTNRFTPGESDVRWLDQQARWTAPADAIRVGLVATYARWKGQGAFIRAAAILARDPANSNLRFYIVGGPIYATRGSQFSADELQGMIDSLGLRDRVALVGRADDLIEVYRALDVVVHASTKPEPFGLTIAEAMSCGRAVIVSAAGGARELFTPNIDALAISPGDVDAMASAINRLAHDSVLCGELGYRAREATVAKFSRDRMATETLAVYRSLFASI